MASRRVAFISDTKLIEVASQIPHMSLRFKLVTELIKAYGLYSKMSTIAARKATQEEIVSFHSKSYLQFLQTAQNQETAFNGDETEDSIISDEFGLGYDCPTLDNMSQFVEIIAGASLTGADLLVSGTCDVAINWHGGWHHAQRDEARGFCYVNDIVIAIHALQKRFKKILYIDLDAHHGDGVENAFSYSKNVLTLSIHQFEPGYFPGTGKVTDIGHGCGRSFAVNAPIRSGITNEPFFELFSTIFDAAMKKFSAQAIVVQCGADFLAGDPLGKGNLTEVGLAKCVQTLLDTNLPMLLLGGGGYHPGNTARCWAYITSIVCGVHLDTDIPENQYFLHYGPTFELNVAPTLRKNENTTEYLGHVVKTVISNLGST